jgi:anti-sigma factor RsiW
MNDDTLVLYYYGDGLSDDERAAVEAALGNDASLRERYRELRLSLDRFSEPPAAPAPAQAVARWHRSVEEAAAGPRVGTQPAGRGCHFLSFAWRLPASASTSEMAACR